MYVAANDIVERLILLLRLRRISHPLDVSQWNISNQVSLFNDTISEKDILYVRIYIKKTIPLRRFLGVAALQVDLQPHWRF